MLIICPKFLVNHKDLIFDPIINCQTRDALRALALSMRRSSVIRHSSCDDDHSVHWKKWGTYRRVPAPSSCRQLLAPGKLKVVTTDHGTRGVGAWCLRLPASLPSWLCRVYSVQRHWSRLALLNWRVCSYTYFGSLTMILIRISWSAWMVFSLNIHIDRKDVGIPHNN